jgi:hypothetical protein
MIPRYRKFQNSLKINFQSRSKIEFKTNTGFPLSLIDDSIGEMMSSKDTTCVVKTCVLVNKDTNGTIKIWNIAKKGNIVINRRKRKARIYFKFNLFVQVNRRSITEVANIKFMFILFY